MGQSKPVRAFAAAWLACLAALASCTAPTSDVDLDAAFSELTYVSPTGSGEQTGRSPEHALALSDVEDSLERRRGDVALVFAAGRYELQESISIRDRGPNVRTALIGDGEGALFSGQAELAEDERKFAAFRLDASNVRFENLRFERLGSCISVVRDARAHNVAILGISAKDVHDCILVDAYERRAASDWIIDGLEIDGFRRVGVRLAGVETRNVRLENAVIDGANSFDRSDCYKGGVQILEGAHHITLRNVVIRNIVGSCGEEYGQGDGVEVHDRGGAPHDLLFESVTVENSRDGGFDLKGRNVRLVDVRTVRGPESRYAFRFWNYPGYVCERCDADGADAALIFARNGSAVFETGRLTVEGETALCVLDPESDYREETFVEIGGAVELEGGSTPASCAAPAPAPSEGG